MSWFPLVHGSTVLAALGLDPADPAFLEDRKRHVVALVLHGLFYAATDGVLSAKVSESAPESLRASGLSVVQTGQALGRLVSSVAFGLLLQYTSFSTGVTVALAALTVTLIVSYGINREQPASA